MEGTGEPAAEPGTEIRYRLAPEDLAAFVVRYAESSASLTRRHGTIRLTWTILIAVPFGLLAYVLADLAPAIAGLVGALFFFFWYPVAVRRSLRSAAASAYAEGDHSAILGEQLLRVEEGGLRSERESGGFFMRWPHLQRIDATATHVHIFYTPADAFIIPRASVTAGDLDAFLEQVRERVTKEKGDHGHPSLKPTKG